jgi:hypothetical protein
MSALMSSKPAMDLWPTMPTSMYSFVSPLNLYSLSRRNDSIWPVLLTCVHGPVQKMSFSPTSLEKTRSKPILRNFSSTTAKGVLPTTKFPPA